MIITSRHSIKQDLLAYGEIHLAQMIDNLSDEDLNTIGKLAMKYIPKGGYVSKTIVYAAIEFLEGNEREPFRKKRDLSIYRNDTFQDTENIIARMHINNKKPELMATIKIQRSSNIIDRSRKYKIYVDGPLAWAPYDENKGNGSFEIDAGKHTIIARGNWISSRELSFNINANETKTFEVGVNLLLKYSFLYLILLILLPLSKSYEYSKYFFGFGLPPFLVYLYYETLGRHHYFRIKEK